MLSRSPSRTTSRTTTNHIQYLFLINKNMLLRAIELYRHSFFMAKNKTYNFLHSGYENRDFSPLPQKHRIWPLPIKIECLKSQFTILGFASEGNLCDLSHSLFFWPWVVIYNFLRQWKNTRIFESRRGRKIRAFWPLTIKSIYIIYKSFVR